MPFKVLLKGVKLTVNFFFKLDLNEFVCKAKQQ